MFSTRRERFRCNVNCAEDGANCIAERLFMETADSMVANGYRKAGYNYVNIDDCVSWPVPCSAQTDCIPSGTESPHVARVQWMAHDSVAGNVTANKTRFPAGMKALATYMHTLDMRMGIYTAISEYTCAYSDNRPIHTLGGPGLGCGRKQLEADGCASMRRNIANLVSFGIDHLKVYFLYAVAMELHQYECIHKSAPFLCRWTGAGGQTRKVTTNRT
jgi:hypothetical protein